MPVSLTPSHIAAVHKGFKRLGRAPPAGYSPEQILFARQRGYKIANNYRPGNGLLNSQVPNITNNNINANRNSRKIINSSGIKRRRRKTRKSRV